MIPCLPLVAALLLLHLGNGWYDSRRRRARSTLYIP
jgi:hypothetical protein